MDRSAQVAHGIHICDINWREGCLSTTGLDAVIQFFKPTGGLSYSNDMKFLRKLQRQSWKGP